VDNKFRSDLEHLFVDERGTATVEYIVILTVVSLGVVLALVSIGPTFFRLFLAQVLWVLLPFS
jgi:Flp pilus assembly pilin Flp